MPSSQQFSLDMKDLESWAKGLAIYAGIPALVLFLTQVIQIIPVDWKYSTIVVILLQALIGLLKKYTEGPSGTPTS